MRVRQVCMWGRGEVLTSSSILHSGTYVGGNTRGLGGGERQRDEAIFTSLLPVNGKVSGKNDSEYLSHWMI